MTACNGAVTSPLPEYSAVMKSSLGTYVTSFGEICYITGSESSVNELNRKSCRVTS